MTYSLITVKGTASTTISAVDGPYQSTKAHGTVQIVDYYAAVPQRLIAGTRFIDNTGRIYRLTSSIVVPGAQSSSTPGKILAQITADQPGQSFNISKNELVGDLKIAAYKGLSKYDTIYGKIVSDIAGGFEGTKKSVNPAAIASSTALLKLKLAASLVNQVKTTVPDSYIMYPNSYVTTFGTPIVGGAEQGQASVSLTGTAYGILFKRSDLEGKLAGDKLNVFGNFAYTSQGLDELTFQISNAKDFSPDKKGTLVFHVTGNLSLIGTVPVEDLKAKLAGVSLSKTQDLIRPFNAVIESGSGELVPPWANVPSDPSRISIIIKAP